MGLGGQPLPSHHEWFKKALAEPDGPYAWITFILSKVTKNPTTGKATLGAVFGMVPGTNKYYLHSFHKRSPDLNWQKLVLRVKRFTPWSTGGWDEAAHENEPRLAVPSLYDNG